MKPSERIDKRAMELKGRGDYKMALNAYMQAILEYLDEQAEQRKEVGNDES